MSVNHNTILKINIFVSSLSEPETENFGLWSQTERLETDTETFDYWSQTLRLRTRLETETDTPKISVSGSKQKVSLTFGFVVENRFVSHKEMLQVIHLFSQ